MADDDVKLPTRIDLPSPVDICETAAALASPTPLPVAPTDQKNNQPQHAPSKRPTPPRSSPMRARMIQLYRLRRYEVQALSQTTCPTCTHTPAGTLAIWQNALGAQCTICNTVFDTHNLRNHLETFFARESSLVAELEQQLSDCLHLMSVLESNVINLRLAVAERNLADKSEKNSSSSACGGVTARLHSGGDACDSSNSCVEEESEIHSEDHSDDDRVCWAV